MNFRFTFFILFLIYILLSSVSSPQQLIDKNKIIPLTPRQLLSMAHQNNEHSDVPIVLKSTIIESYNVNQFGPDNLTNLEYSIYEDSLRIKNCYMYLVDPWNNGYVTLFYDSQNRVVKTIQSNAYNGMESNGLFIFFYSYNSNGKISQELFYRDETPYERFSNNYDSNNYLISYLDEMWTGSVWEISRRLSYTNNLLGSPVSAIWEYWDKINLVWYNDRYTSYEYDVNNLLISELHQYWVNGAWQDNYRYTYSYNGNLLFAQLYEYKNGNNWVQSSKSVYTYNTDNTVSNIVYVIWNGLNWIKYSYDNYSYPVGKFLRLTTYPTNYNYFPGSSIPVQWIGSGITNVNIKISTDNGITWNNSASGVPDTGTYTSFISAPLNESPNCKIRVEDAADPNIYDQNIGKFSILAVYDTLTHNTGKVKMTVFNNGIIGSNGTIGQGFSFMNSPNALYSGGVFFGNVTTGAYGMLLSYRINDLGMSIPMRAFTSNSNFNTISTAYYSDSIAGSPYNVFIKEQTFGKTNNPYIFYLYNLQNKSSNTLSSFYLGTFADWDIGNAFTNLGGYSVSRKMAYEFDSSGLNPNYYGIVALSGMSGANVTQVGYTSSYRSNLIWDISYLSSAPITSAGDYRTLIGSGPYDIPAGGTKEVGFAFVSGANLADLESNADLAIADWNAGLVGINDKNSSIPSVYSLKQNYPNPFNPVTIIEYSLPKETTFKIELFNSIGQKIKELYKGVQNAGNHKIYLDGSGLSTGVYFYRFTSEQFNETKKLILLK